MPIGGLLLLEKSVIFLLQQGAIRKPLGRYGQGKQESISEKRAFRTQRVIGKHILSLKRGDFFLRKE